MTPEEKHEERQDAIDARCRAETELEDEFYESEKKRLLDDKIKNSTKTYEDMEKSDNERGARKEMTQQTKLTKIREQLAKTRDLHYTILEVRANLEREVDNLLETERIEVVRLISWLDKIIEKEIKEVAN